MQNGSGLIKTFFRYSACGNQKSHLCSDTANLSWERLLEAEQKWLMPGVKKGYRVYCQCLIRYTEAGYDFEYGSQIPGS